MTSSNLLRACLLSATALCATGLSAVASAQTAPAAPAPAPTATPTPAPNPAKPLKPLTGKVEPRWGNIRTFWGDVSPYWGNIRTFWGDVNPYEGDLSAFWGNIRTFNDGTTAGNLSPLWGNIRTFSGELGAQWGNIRTFWGNIRTFSDAPGDYASLADQLKALVQQSETFWGGAVQTQTGKSFSEAFSNPMLSKYGIDLGNPESLARLTPDQRERFFLDWYDGLMNYSGADHVDHWMKAINWTPKLTQIQGSGADSVIGLVDFYAANDPDVKNKLIYSGGVSTVDNGHGVAVLSLMVASHDGKGVMGIAPNAKIAAYNPFDATQTADWAAVRMGITEVTKRGAAVVNLSLGVPNWTLHPDWQTVLKSKEVDAVKNKTIFVIAAGNDGITQTQNVNMKDAFDTTFLVVGSVDPSGKISDFSNRPGTTCLLDGDSCKYSSKIEESGLLMNRFIVAPGEFILVSDGKGGVTRMSGTSFAAPLVSGAIALIHDRWPWLKTYPRDVAKAILASAKDLGAPGIDPVYGVGMLDVEAAQSALDFNKLKYYLVDPTKRIDTTVTGTTTTTAVPTGAVEIKVDALRTTGIQSAWVTKDMYFTAFEPLLQTKRDFLIPLSSRLVGTQRNGEYFQEFVYNRFMSWMGGGASSVAGAAPFGRGFSDLNRVPMYGVNEWSLSMTGKLLNTAPGIEGYYRPRLQTSVDVQSPSGKFGFSFGHGDGAVFLGGQQATQLTSDFDAYSGGVNPLLGFASGGAHVAGRVEIAPSVKVSLGMTSQRRDLRDDLHKVTDINDRRLLNGLDPYKSAAANLRVDYKASPWLNLAASLTRLDEANALLGVRSIEERDLADGSFTDGVTISADAAIGSGFSLFGSATGARTSSGGKGLLQVSDGGLKATAFQVGVSKQRLLGKGDNLRLTIAQPLTVENGSIEMQMVKVIDRATGEIGVVNERFDIAGPGRRYIAEAVYGGSILDGRGEVALFGRAELRQVDATMPRMMAGSRLRLAF
ncbi:S8 family peptidase [Sphingomonas sp.]|jgi:hypothetical protein|uniref:S8 family peptidase n=1 Tax=Sphingomonas sp. TaxID=28214 RepID=UPI002EDA98ED